jgi:radical SAM superfamily enzyme YgiQ (UPF0313 family)
MLALNEEALMLLIHPSSTKFGGIFSRNLVFPIPQAVGTLAAYLRKHGVRANVLVDEITPVEPGVLEEALTGLDRPYLFGISCLTINIGRAYALAAMLKGLYPDCRVVLGGIHATAMPEEALSRGTVDFIVSGEGERSLLELHNAIRGGGDYSSVKGICYMEDGELKHTGPADLIDNLDSIPVFPYELFDGSKFDMGTIITSRGCPYHCTFCSIHLTAGNRYRYKSTGRVIEELDILINKYNQKQIRFWDDNFCTNGARVKELCSDIIDSGLSRKCVFSVQSRADNFTPDIVPVLASAGFKHVCFGMETGVDRLAGDVQKGETVQQNLDAVQLALDHGFHVSLSMIFGFPTETHADREQSFNVTRQLGVDDIKFNNLIPYPGTPLYESLKADRRVHIEPDWVNFDSSLSLTRNICDSTPLPYVPETSSEFELKRDIIYYNIRANLRRFGILSIVTRRLFGKVEARDWQQLTHLRRPKHILSERLRDIGGLIKEASFLSFNFLVALLPLAWTERAISALNPSLRRRQRTREGN